LETDEIAPHQAAIVGEARRRPNQNQSKRSKHPATPVRLSIFSFAVTEAKKKQQTTLFPYGDGTEEKMVNAREVANRSPFCGHSQASEEGNLL